MTIGIVGVKRGMTRIFTEEGDSIPVTVIEATPNRITQRKTVETDGYDAIQVTSGQIKASRVKKPLAGHFKKANVDAGRRLYEFRCEADAEANVGDSLSLEGFEAGQKVDVTGQSKG
ncbi:MAG: 50S ribosomal protein L3, partial [Pseudomonadales bacterium]